MKMLTTADKLLIAVFTCIIVASLALVKASSGEGSVVLIQVDGTTVHKTSLRETHTIAIHGTRGQLTVEIREGKVAITQAQCPNHICVKTGWRSHSGEIIVCVPNNTVVRIAASGENQVRATTG